MKYFESRMGKLVCEWTVTPCLCPVTIDVVIHKTKFNDNNGKCDRLFPIYRSTVRRNLSSLICELPFFAATALSQWYLFSSCTSKCVFITDCQPHATVYCRRPSFPVAAAHVWNSLPKHVATAVRTLHDCLLVPSEDPNFPNFFA